MKPIMEKLEHLLQLGGIKKDILFLVLSGIAIVCSLLGLSPFPFDMAWIAIILCGVPIILEAIIGLVTAFDIKADVLVSLALIASVFIGEDFAAGEVAFIMQLGSLLEELTVARARAGIEKLVHLTPQTARVLRGGTEQVIPAQDVHVGDRLRVLPGESIPVDGVIVSGQTSINQAVMTGESLPVDKAVGDTVSSGTVNQFGAFEMEATKVGEDSSIQRMIRLVQSADAGKARIVGLAVSGCGQGKDCGDCGPLGYLDRCNCSERGGTYMAVYRRNYPGRDHPCSVLPLCPGTGNPYRYHGSHRQCDKAWLFGSGGGCLRTSLESENHCL